MNDPNGGDRADIVCLCTLHSLGGAQIDAARFTQGFRERGYKAALVFLYDFQVDEGWRGQSDVYILAPKRPASPLEWLRFIRRCQKLFAGLRPNVTIGFHPLAIIVGAIMMAGRGKMVAREAWPAQEQSWFTERVETLLCRLGLIHAHIPVSRFVASTFSHRGSAYESRTTVIHNAPPPMLRVDDDPGACRRQLGMTQGAPLLGCIGRLHEQKNFALAIRTLTYLGAGVHLYIAGDGPQREMLEALAAELGLSARVHFLGARKGADVVRFYRAVDILLMPSLYEGHPLVMLEAMTVGAPVLANDIPVMREAGEDAVMYAPADPKAWAEAIAACDEEKRKRSAAAGRAHVAKLCGSSMVDQCLAAVGLPKQKELAQ